jgi:amino acid transporter
VFVAFFYFAVTVANAGLVPWESLAKSTESIPILAPVEIALGEKGAVIILVAGICGLLTTMNAFMLGGSRLLMAMAKDGEIPRPLAYVNSRFGTPSVALVFLGIMGVLGSVFTELIVLFDTAASAVLLCYLLVVVAVMRLRRKEPDMERPYKMWGYPAVPILAIVSIIPAWGISILLLKSWAIGILVGWMLAGILYFLLFRRKAAA